MKGFIIYENDLRRIDAVKLKNASFCYESIEDDITDTLKGRPVTCESANCSKDDTYDFQTGALIALMKMCGVEKVKKAAKETFFDVAENSVNEYEEKIHALEKEIKRLNNVAEGFYNFNSRLIDEIDQKNHEIISLKALKLTNESLKEENEKLKKENDHLKYIKSCNESTIESLENTRDLLINKNNELIEENKELKKNIDELFESEQHSKSELGRLYFEKHRLEEKVEKLKIDCEKLRLYKPTTKREEMWAELFTLHKESDVIIKVKKEDVNTFLHEIEKRIPKITWLSTVKIFETKYTIGDIYEELKTCDMIYFRLSKENTLSYSNDEFIYAFRGLKPIDYLPPMRWDLFKKGRIVVKVDADNYEDFYNKCEVEIGRKPHYTCKGTFTVYYKNGIFHTRPYKDTIPFAKKIVDWEDVR